MKKLFTENHKNILTCDDFEIKLKDYLNFIKIKNKYLHDMFLSPLDFSILELDKFKSEFNVFFKLWLQKRYNYDLDSNESNIALFVDSYMNKFKTTDVGFNELFTNFNFYKRINSAKDAFYIYDISNNEEERYNEILKKAI